MIVFYVSGPMNGWNQSVPHDAGEIAVQLRNGGTPAHLKDEVLGPYEAVYERVGDLLVYVGQRVR